MKCNCNEAYTQNKHRVRCLECGSEWDTDHTTIKNLEAEIRDRDLALVDAKTENKKLRELSQEVLSTGYRFVDAYEGSRSLPKNLTKKSFLYHCEQLEQCLKDIKE